MKNTHQNKNRYYNEIPFLLRCKVQTEGVFYAKGFFFIKKNCKIYIDIIIKCAYNTTRIVESDRRMWQNVL